MRYAIVENGVVTNVVMWDGNAPTEDENGVTTGWAPPEGSNPVQLGDDGHADIGWAYDGATFTAPAAA